MSSMLQHTCRFNFCTAFEQLGNPWWNWESFNKYSQKAESFHPPDHDEDILTYDLAYRGKSGMLPAIYCF